MFAVSQFSRVVCDPLMVAGQLAIASSHVTQLLDPFAENVSNAIQLNEPPEWCTAHVCIMQALITSCALTCHADWHAAALGLGRVRISRRVRVRWGGRQEDDEAGIHYTSISTYHHHEIYTCICLHASDCFYTSRCWSTTTIIVLHTNAVLPANVAWRRSCSTHTSPTPSTRFG